MTLDDFKVGIHRSTHSHAGADLYAIAALATGNGAGQYLEINIQVKDHIDLDAPVLSLGRHKPTPAELATVQAILESRGYING